MLIYKIKMFKQTDNMKCLLMVNILKNVMNLEQRL